MGELTTVYIVEWDGGGDYCCRNCAAKVADELGLEWNNPNTLNFTEVNGDGVSIWADIFRQLESDSPQACECGQWLRVNLTPDGRDYLQEIAADMPDYVLNYYEIKKELI